MKILPTAKININRILATEKNNMNVKCIDSFDIDSNNIIASIANT